jgi:hypothetical protein
VSATAAVGLAEVAGEHAAAPVQLAHPPPARVLRTFIYCGICYYFILFKKRKRKERKRKRGEGASVMTVTTSFSWMVSSSGDSAS